MNVLITGGAGFIGSHVAEFHLKLGDRVTVLDDLSTGSIDNIAPFRHDPNFRFEQADIVTSPRLAQLAQWAGRIYHLAGVVGMFRVLKSPLAVMRVNVEGTAKVLEAAANSPRLPQVVIASSSSVYGHDHGGDLAEDSPLNVSSGHPITPYAMGKLTNELQARAYYETFKLPVVSARLFNCVGRRQSAAYGFVLPRFVQQALAGQPLTVFGDGRQTRSFCDVRDTVAILDALAQVPAAWGQTVNVGNDHEISIEDLAELVQEHAPRMVAIEHVPYAQAYGRDFRQVSQRRPVLDRLRELTGYRHRFAIEDTVRELFTESRLAAATAVPAALLARGTPATARTAVR